jgi:hypothetical protein
MKQACEFFPEYAERHFIGAIASLYVDESVVRHGQNQGLLVLGLGDYMMEVLNEPEFEPTKFGRKSVPRHSPRSSPEDEREV